MTRTRPSRALRGGPLALGALAFVCVSSAQAGFDLRAAIASAATGDVIDVPGGRYDGPIIIDRPLSLNALDGAVIDGHGRGDVVRITAAGVALRGFLITGSGAGVESDNNGVLVLAAGALVEDNRIEDSLFGVTLRNAPGSTIRRNTIIGKDLDVPRRGDAIRLWQSGGTLIESNTAHRGRDIVLWYSDDVVIRGNTVTGSRYGLHFMFAHNNVLEGNHLEDNSVGAFLMYSRNAVIRGNVFARNRGPSGYGLGLKDMQGVTAQDNVFLSNRVGVWMDSPPVTGAEYDTFSGNVLAFNDIGLAFAPAVKQTAFHSNSFMENLQQVAILGSGSFTGNLFTVNGRGNFWSDYRGYDFDGDGVGDRPQRVESLFEDLMQREPRLRLFLHTPAQQAIDLASRALPIMQPDPKIIDDAPLMAPVLAALAEPPAPGPGMWLAAGALLSAAALLMVGGARPIGARNPGALGASGAGAGAGGRP